MIAYANIFGISMSIIEILDYSDSSALVTLDNGMTAILSRSDIRLTY